MKYRRSLVLLAAALTMTACAESNAASAAASQTLPSPTATVSPTPTPEPEPEVFRVRFSATGDNLIHDAVYRQAERRAGDGSYDFSYCYKNLQTFYDGFDLNWINQETLITDTLPPSTYPFFSTPGDMGRDLYDLGMRVFSLSNNHTYDQDAQGVADTLAYWEVMPGDVSFSGLYNDEQENLGVVLREQNGITFAFLSYTEFTNGLPTPKDSPAHIIYTSETELIRQQVELADELADFVVVSCHWGVEDSHQVIDKQRELAQNLSNWGTDLVIGTHAHVVQDAEWMTAEDGRRTFVTYSLGNSLSAQSKPHQVIGMILDMEFEKTVHPNGQITLGLGEPRLHPVVNHYDWGHANIRLYLFEDYTEELAETHGVREREPAFDREYIKNVLETNVTRDYLVF